MNGDYPNQELKWHHRFSWQGGCDNLLQHMADFRWSRSHENVTKLNTIDEMTNTSKENHIIVLPEEARMTEAIEAYILKSYRLFHGWCARTIFIHNEG